ncbi:uncharacterized protein LOC105421258 isoform X2 [Amborella trichopoda]|uniref:uncharacterized protein LOC105421258 isoform X2 n=1 Tax=Amborella trichopoda TaxID=13333 RepID=UPI0009BD49F2|nr:uncharacterized protein LOC105421258 isoform X2 [Amborella trichopoda]|eukprot:XP_020525294.1 uncharacterized protein LOC105421258 isoform X2 [Amborella trichopoda]
MPRKDNQDKMIFRKWWLQESLTRWWWRQESLTSRWDLPLQHLLMFRTIPCQTKRTISYATSGGLAVQPLQEHACFSISSPSSCMEDISLFLKYINLFAAFDMVMYNKRKWKVRTTSSSYPLGLCTTNGNG